MLLPQLEILDLDWGNTLAYFPKAARAMKNEKAGS